MTTIALGVLVFTAIVLLLVLVLMAAKAALVSSEAVQIRINNDPAQTIRAEAGRTLLSTLASSNIFLPSACGGKGTCGVCRVRVLEGGGAALPTEIPLLSLGEQQQGIRLACQLKVKGDLSIAVPEEVMGIREWPCTVRSSHNVATFIKELVLECSEDFHFRAGGYIQVEVPPHEVAFADFKIDEDYRADWDRLDMWRYRSRVLAGELEHRAYSLANPPLERGTITLNVRIATPPAEAVGAPPGKASSYIFSLKPGDPVTVSGPFGNFFAKEGDAEMVFIGGGAGMAPLRSIILDQLRGRSTEPRVSYWYGARSLREAFYVEDFEALAQEQERFHWCLALSEPLPEDAWNGATGFVHQVAYERYLKDHPAPEDIEYYLCGPPMMMKACLAMLTDLGVEEHNILFDEF